MIHIDEAIIVEGKYDKIRLCGVADCLILQTNGFRIFKDRERRALAHGPGVAKLTDAQEARQ